MRLRAPAAAGGRRREQKLNAVERENHSQNDSCQKKNGLFHGSIRLVISITIGLLVSVNVLASLRRVTGENKVASLNRLVAGITALHRRLVGRFAVLTEGRVSPAAAHTSLSP